MSEGNKDFVINLDLYKNKFDAKLQQVREEMNSQMGGLIHGKIEAFLTAAGIEESIRRTLEWGESIKSAALKASISTDAIQAFTYAAKMNGAEMGNVVAAIRKEQLARLAALKGHKDYVSAFERLGVTLQDLKHKSPEEIFKMLATHIQHSKGGSQELADIMKVLGRNATALIPAFREGFADFAEEAKSLGLIVDKQMIQQLDESAKVVRRLTIQFQTLLAPVVTLLVDKIEKMMLFLRMTVDYFVGLSTWITEGVSFNDAYKVAGDMVKEDMNKYVDEKEAQARRAEEVATLRNDEVEIETKPDKKGSFNRPSADQLTRIGLFIGTSAAQAIQQQQLVQLKGIKRSVDQLNREVADEL